MAKIGLIHPVAALITGENYGYTPTYGTGFRIGKAVQADINIETTDNSLYGDDALAEQDANFTSGTVTIGVTDFGMTADENLDVQAAMLGNTIVTENGVKTLRAGANDVAPYLGFGFVKTKQINNVRYYEATWFYKTKFHEPSDSTTTKGKQIQWQTPSITGDILVVEGFRNDAWKESALFTTPTQADQWLYAKANISTTVSKTALAASITSAEALDPEEYTSASYADVKVALIAASAVNANAYAGQADVDSANTALTNAVAALVERS